jgi:hypothetical protein
LSMPKVESQSPIGAALQSRLRGVLRAVKYEMQYATQVVCHSDFFDTMNQPMVLIP